jgi:hypothetical protein
VSRFDLAKIVDKLARQDDAILVRELAKEIYPSLLFGNDPPAYHPSTASSLGVADEGALKKPLEAMKRSSSDNPPTLAILPNSTTRPMSERRESREVNSDLRRSTSSKAVPITMREVKDRAKVDVFTTPVKDDEAKRHKRKISRSQLRSAIGHFVQAA